MDPVKRYETPSNCLTVLNVYSKTTLGPAYNEHSAITIFFVSKSLTPRTSSSVNPYSVLSHVRNNPSAMEGSESGNMSELCS